MFFWHETQQSDIINNTNNANPFVREWNLKQVSGGFSQLESFQRGDVIFDFMENDSVKINLNIILQSTSKVPIKNDTIIYYEFDSLKILLGSQEYEYRFEEAKLKLIDNLASDGIMMELEK